MSDIEIYVDNNSVTSFDKLKALESVDPACTSLAMMLIPGKFVSKAGLIDFMERGIAYGASVESVAGVLLDFHPWILPSDKDWQRGRLRQSAVSTDGELAAVTYLLEKGLSAQYLRDSGSLLHLVSWTAGKFSKKVTRESSLDLAQRMLDGKADPNCTNHDGFTPLHLAVQSLSKNMVTLLLKYGGLSDLQNRFGVSAADLASGFGVEAIDITSVLMQWRKRYNKKIRKRIAAYLSTKILSYACLSAVLKTSDIIADYAEIEASRVWSATSSSAESLGKSNPFSAGKRKSFSRKRRPPSRFVAKPGKVSRR